MDQALRENPQAQAEEMPNNKEVQAQNLLLREHQKENEPMTTLALAGVVIFNT
jgi:hypothetical protein